MTAIAKISTCIWMEKDGLKAARLYVSLFADSRIDDEARLEHMLTHEPDGVAIIDFTLAGTPFRILQAGPYQEHNDMMSISVMTEDQAETDRLWAALTAGGGQESQCGWLKDRWGIAWQIVPRRMHELVGSGDAVRIGRMMQAMMPMKKLNIAALEAAFAGG